MSKKKIINEKIKNIIIVILTIIQIGVYIISKYSNNVTEVEVSNTIIQEKEQLSTVINELNNINGLKIAEIEDKNDKWKVDTSIEGTNNEVKLALSKLTNFNISNYTICGEVDNLSVKLELYR